MEYNLARRKDKIINFFATWMELEGTKLSKMSQKEKKDRYQMALLICGV